MSMRIIDKFPKPNYFQLVNENRSMLKMKFLKPMSPYGEFVQRARAGGTVVVETLEQARNIIRLVQKPIVIKILGEFQGAYRSGYLHFCVEAEDRGVWVICGEAAFLEPTNDKH